MMLNDNNQVKRSDTFMHLQSIKLIYISLASPQPTLASRVYIPTPFFKVIKRHVDCLVKCPTKVPVTLPVNRIK